MNSSMNALRLGLAWALSGLPLCVLAADPTAPAAGVDLKPIGELNIQKSPGSDPAPDSPQSPAPAGAGDNPPAPADTAKGETQPPSPEPAKEAAAPAAAAKPVQRTATTRPAAVNTFNRLMKPPSQRNPAPPNDGIHDPTEEGTKILQPPKEAFSALPSSSSGNYVNWVEALSSDKISPRFDRLDPEAKPIVMDLNIVREVKGSMPDVVYPHKQHTEWLDCSNCHPKPFIPQKGANQISMAAILLGEKCGLCHGKVAFPVAECRRCHSRKKEQQATSK